MNNCRFVVKYGQLRSSFEVKPGVFLNHYDRNEREGLQEAWLVISGEVWQCFDVKHDAEAFALAVDVEVAESEDR